MRRALLLVGVAALALLVAGLARAVRQLTRRGPDQALTPAASTDGSSRLLLVLLPAGGLVGLVSFVVFGAPWLLAHQVSPAAPGQPIAFDHQVHSQVVGLDCAFCHRTAHQDEAAGLPDVEQCMFCHVVVDRTVAGGPNAASIETLQSLWMQQQPIDWLRVHRLPDHSRFPHEAHVQAGLACATCHGEVDQMGQVIQTRSLKMGDCVACHQQTAAPTDCGVCHY
jgi:hypothetical protein